MISDKITIVTEGPHIHLRTYSAISGDYLTHCTFHSPVDAEEFADELSCAAHALKNAIRNSIKVKIDGKELSLPEAEKEVARLQKLIKDTQMAIEDKLDMYGIGDRDE